MEDYGQYVESCLKVYRQRVKRSLLSGEELLDDFLIFLKSNKLTIKEKEKEKDKNGGT